MTEARGYAETFFEILPVQYRIMLSKNEKKRHLFSKYHFSKMLLSKIFCIFLKISLDFPGLLIQMIQLK